VSLDIFGCNIRASQRANRSTCSGLNFFSWICSPNVPEHTTIPCPSRQSMTFMNLQRSKHYGVCYEPPLTIETCSLQQSSVEHPWSTRKMQASSCRFLCLRRSLKQPPRIGTFVFWRRGTIWSMRSTISRDEYDAMLEGKATTATDELLARVETILRNERFPGTRLSRNSGSKGRCRETQNERLCCSFPM
jgi:hypothetical protein